MQNKSELILDAAEFVSYRTVTEVINLVSGNEYKAWMKGTWQGNGFRVWIPKLSMASDTEDSAAGNGCVNKLSADWNELVYVNMQGKRTTHSEAYSGYEVVFAREPKNGNCIFRGIFVRDNENSTGTRNVFRRVAAKAVISGLPGNRKLMM